MEAALDRAHRADGTLASRKLPGAAITDLADAALRAVDLCHRGALTTLDGTQLALEVDSLCTHGDSPGAARAALEGAGIRVASLARVLAPRAGWRAWSRWLGTGGRRRSIPGSGSVATVP
jgi:UPF0271 protein